MAAFQADIGMIKTGTVGQRESHAPREVRTVLGSHPPTQKRTQGGVVTGRSASLSLWQLLKTTVQEWLADEASLLAAALSYYTAISLAPLLVLLVVIVGFFLSQATARTQVLDQLRGAIGTQGAQFLAIILENADQPGVASLAGILSFLTLVWGSTNVFSQLQTSLNKIWDVEPKPGRGLWATLRERLLSFSLVLGVAFLLLVSFVLSAVLAALSGLGQSWVPGLDWLWQLLNFLVSFGVITLLFAAIYKVLPDAKVVWRDVWLGAAVTALLFTVGKTVLGWYLANTGSTYGAAGSLIVFLLWVYYSAQILFFGAEFTQVYARAYGAGIQPAADAQWIDAPGENEGKQDSVSA
jgi:membrane protein